MKSNPNYFKTFCKISKAFGTTLELDDLLNLIVESAIESMEGKAACLFLLDENENLFYPAAQKGLSENYLHAKPVDARRRVETILKEGGYLAVADATTDPRMENHEAKKAEGIASILVVPVIVRSKAIGLLSLYTSTRREFTQDEIDFLSALADHGGMAVQTARLFKRISDNAQLFLDIAVNINSTLDIRKILHILSENVAEAFQVKASSIRLLDDNGATLKLVASWGLSEEYINKGPVLAEKGIQEALKNQPVVVRDVATDEGVQYREEKQKEGIRSILSVPIRSKDEVVGVMRLYSDTPRDFHKDEILLAMALAQQGGLAIQNASMYLALQEDKQCLEQDIWSHRQWF